MCPLGIRDIPAFPSDCSVIGLRCHENDMTYGNAQTFTSINVCDCVIAGVVRCCKLSASLSFIYFVLLIHRICLIVYDICTLAIGSCWLSSVDR